MKVICNYCGVEFDCPPYKLSQQRHFCSRKCVYLFQSKKIELKCDNCGKTIYRSPSLVNRHNFCSKGCYSVWLSKNVRGKRHPGWNRVELRCEACGKVFYRPPYRIKEYTHHFCSTECWNKRKGELTPNWRGGDAVRICKVCGKEFKTKQAIVRKRYGLYCSRKCLATAKLRRLASERPNKSEIKLQEIFKKHELPFRYTGDGSFWIGFKNPDFVNINSKKQVIELFGRYWHLESDEEEKKRVYAEYGYDTLVIWDEELKDEQALVEKVRAFMNNNQEMEAKS